MATVQCAVCSKEGNSREMYHCSRCNLWVHYKCGGGSTGLGGFFSSEATCPNCGRKLSK